MRDRGNRSRGGHWAAARETWCARAHRCARAPWCAWSTWCAPVSKKCLLVRFADSHSYSVSYKHIPRMPPMKLLHIDSSVLGPHSVSRQVSAAIVDRLYKATPAVEIVYRDLSSMPLAHLSGWHLAA